jgi:hypothetical protein
MIESIGVTLDLGDHTGCVAGAYCSAHKCVARVKRDGACAADEECDVGLACHRKKCGASSVSDSGGPCATTHDCKPGLYCNAAPPSDGTCAPRRAAGAACTSDDACKGLCIKKDGGTGACLSFCGSG